MKTYKADLHNHTVLSPCGDLEMTPEFILSQAKAKEYDIIGITDHNTTLQAREIKKYSSENTPYILCGVEITTSEEVHCLAFVDGEENLNKLEDYLRSHLPKIPNNVDLFGYQLLVNKEEEVLYEEEVLLISAIDQNVDQVEAFVHSLSGIFIPAHVDKKKNSIISQLGFIPPSLNIDAIEFSANCDVQAFLNANKYINKLNTTFIRSSDAHYPIDYLNAETIFKMKEINFEEIKAALKNIDGRSVEIKY